MGLNIERELRSQHDALLRMRYDGHNRRPIALTMARLQVRRRRRRINRFYRLIREFSVV
jgi:hypothetical protein